MIFTINLIQTLDAYNKAQDFSPYERLMSTIYNSLNPDVKTPQPPPPPPPPHHESFWNEVIGIVVSVVVMIVAPEAVGALAFSAAFSSVGLATLTAGQLAIAYAVGGALADMATQGVAIAFNDQHGFSIQSMVENAIAAGATAGLSKALKIEGLLSEEHPEYVKAFAESAAIGTTVQLFQLGMGLRNKIDWKFIIEQAGTTVLSSKLNKGLSNAPGIIRHAADEAANTALASTLGQKPDLTALAGNVLGDEAGDGADLIAKRVRQSHHTTSIGKSSKPSDYSAHAHAHHTDSRYTPDIAQLDDGIGDLYDAYKSDVGDDVQSMNAASIFSLNASSNNSLETVRTQHSGSGFFERGVHRFVREGEMQLNFDVGVIESVAHAAYSVADMLDHPVQSSFALFAAAQRMDNASMYFMHNFIHASTRPKAWAQLQNSLHGVSQSIASEWQDMTTPDMMHDMRYIGRFTGNVGLFAAGGEIVGGLRGAVESVSLPRTEIVNHINSLRLRRSLNIEQAKSIFTETGELTPEIISKSDMIIPGNDLSNTKLIQELTCSGGDISDWGKYETNSILSPSGNFRIHFYRNLVTGDVHYDTDYKVVFDHQGAWNFTLQPNFDYVQFRFNR